MAINFSQSDLHSFMLQFSRLDLGLCDQLQGKPLAYTPFCDSNTDMEGFRFWKRGFWQEHLAGLPYHISALYVVDLARFRQVCRGPRRQLVLGYALKQGMGISRWIHLCWLP